MAGLVRNGVMVLAGLLAVHAIYIAWFGGWEPSIHRSVVLFLCVVVVAGVHPLASSFPEHPAPLRALCWLVDAILVGITGYACWRFIGAIDDIENLIVEFSVWDQVSAVIAIATLLELTRRAFGLTLALVGVLALVYCLMGQDLPWFFRHSGFDLEQTMEVVWYGFQGVFGVPTGIVLSLIFIFIVFGAVLEGVGAGDVLIKIAFALTGRTRGGPAHAAIVASGMFGATSGSVTANVVGTGAFTIPLIKSRGFRGAFAGGVEAAASTGGQIMPPVMGAAAFLMADLTGVPYLEICIAAALPALLYYGSLFVSVSLEARRIGIQPIPASEREKVTGRDILQSFMLLGPVMAILAVLIAGRSPAMAGFWAVTSGIVLAFLLNPALRQDPKRLLHALARGGVAGAKVMMAVGAIGVLLAVLNLTGLGLKFATEIANLGTSSLFLGLVLAAGSCLLLGMGMPTLPAYLIIVLVLGPAIASLGLPVIAVHLFVFYYGVLSAITPPVALAAIAAAPIAKSNPMHTAMIAVNLALVGFLVPFAFVYNPSLLLVVDFSWMELGSVLVRLVLAIWLLSTGFIGFDARALARWQRALRLICGIVLLTTDVRLQAAALVIGLALILVDRWRYARIRQHG